MNATQVLPSEYQSKLTLDRSDIFKKNSWLSKSSIFELYGSSLFRWRYYPRKYSSSSMNWGSLVDCLLTSPLDFESEFVVSPYDNFRTKEAREWKVKQEENNVTVVDESTIAEAQKAIEMLTQKHKKAAALIEKSRKQVVLLNRTTHSAYDCEYIYLKGLVDLAPEGEPFLADLKTTADFSAAGFAKAQARFNYAAQAGHYLRMWNKLHPEDQRHRFQIVWQESSYPYEVAITEIPKQDLEDGVRMFDHLLGRIVGASFRSYFPMRYEDPVMLGRAAFAAITDEEELEGLEKI